MPVVKGDKVHVEFDGVAITAPFQGLVYVRFAKPIGNLEWTPVPTEAVTLIEE